MKTSGYIIVGIFFALYYAYIIYLVIDWPKFLDKHLPKWINEAKARKAINEKQSKKPPFIVDYICNDEKGRNIEKGGDKEKGVFILKIIIRYLP